MKTRFYFNATLANGFTGLFSLGFVLMLIPLLINLDFTKLITLTISALIILVLFWFGLARGTYLIIDQEVLYYTSFFLKGSIIPLKHIIAVKARRAFMGQITHVHIIYNQTDGQKDRRGIGTKEAFKKNNFDKIIEIIKVANPNVEVDSDLLMR